MTILAINWGNAFLITGVGFGLVFIVLILLIFIVKSFGVIFAQKPKAQAAAQAPAATAEATDETDMAAIAYVLHVFYNQHDEESDVLTIRHEDVAYSPWNQKSITF